MKSQWTAFPRNALGIAFLAASIAVPAMAQEAASSTTTTTTVQTTAVPAPPPAQVTTVQQTTVVVAPSVALYLRRSYHGEVKAGQEIFVRPDGRVYGTEGDYVGRLTNLDGEDILPMPARDDFKIRTPGGTIFASTRPSAAFDSDRKVLLGKQDASGGGSTSTSTTRTTTTQQQTTTTP